MPTLIRTATTMLSAVRTNSSSCMAAYGRYSHRTCAPALNKLSSSSFTALALNKPSSSSWSRSESTSQFTASALNKRSSSSSSSSSLPLDARRLLHAVASQWRTAGLRAAHQVHCSTLLLFIERRCVSPPLCTLPSQKNLFPPTTTSSGLCV